jgi:hypothetical protein
MSITGRLKNVGDVIEEHSRGLENVAEIFKDDVFSSWRWMNPVITAR